MIPAHFIAIAIGFLLDRIIGDPPNMAASCSLDWHVHFKTDRCVE